MIVQSATTNLDSIGRASMIDFSDTSNHGDKEFRGDGLSLLVTEFSSSLQPFAS